MVESAVSVPDVDLRPQSPNGVSSPSLKRRQSPEVEPDVSKRPRLDTSDANGTNGANGSHHRSPLPSATSPTQKRTAVPGARTDEKSRNRRLFGGLLSTLSASSNKPSSAIKRRDEIEQRQRERLKRDDEEIAEARRKKKEELDRKRKVEQKQWDEQYTRLRHANMRTTAGFLRTETHPRIYWKPWEMSKEDEERVRRQREEVEETIRSELDGREGRTDSMTNGKTKDDDTATTRHGDDVQVDDSIVHNEQDDAQAGAHDPEKPDPEPSDSGPNGDAVQECAAADASGVPQAQEAVALDDSRGDDDHGGDDIVEGHDEDQVIY